MDQDTTWYGRRPRTRRHCVRWGPSSSSPKRGRSPPPQFSAHVYCGQTAGWIKMALGMEVSLDPGHIVPDGDPAPLAKMRQSPPFSAHFYCGKMAACIKMPFGKEVGLSLSDFVLNGDPAPSPKRGGAPNFRPTSILAKRLHESRCHLVRR